jgi:hypothetical protein
LDREIIPGDLVEEYVTIILPKFGKRGAYFWYWFQVIRTIIYRNRVCRWLLAGGALMKIGEWLRGQIGI